ncbi:NUDIX domain-containing protein [Aureibacillus halotolerans]|uniref:ADP-ribose pyrophosphatase YjhB (NUDIX family) n=1 Tax=Aureibacillus halotolerans TaxID=1508390 RepID=A0A4R6U2U4_9BACI|nr:NUDIX hydrolase [Aureibacillus halotolerans]TDQ40680.1 ADP-ribose pyrophosphatase YjhB (NUDIX family) [Aureibacillus halotolerans]
MAKWYGAAAICIDDEKNLLMVLQGKPEEEKKWSVPSGGKEGTETFEECCRREVLEETGYDVRVVEKLHTKKNEWAEVHYFLVKVIGGTPTTSNDPDGLIYDVAWKSLNDIDALVLSFPEDRSYFDLYVI